jgi:hypothetical protein
VLAKVRARQRRGKARIRAFYLSRSALSLFSLSVFFSLFRSFFGFTLASAKAQKSAGAHLCMYTNCSLQLAFASLDTREVQARNIKIILEGKTHSSLQNELPKKPVLGSRTNLDKKMTQVIFSFCDDFL